MAARKKPTGSTQEERDRISRGRIESFIDGIAAKHLQCPTCKNKMDISDLKDIPPSVASLIRARYDKLRPSLQAIEQSTTNSKDKLTEAEIEAKLAAVVSERPELLENLVSLALKVSPELRDKLIGMLGGAPVAQTDIVPRLTH